jgi:hypothetical protein
MHSFDPEIAKKVGVNAAVIYQNIVWWTQKNAANNKHHHDGRHWTYNSIKAFDVLFPYLTTAQIRRALEKLETSGLLLSGTFNKIGYNLLQNTTAPVAKRNSPLSQNATPLTL